MFGFVNTTIPSQEPICIVRPSKRRHSTFGFGLPVAAQRNRKCLFSSTTTGDVSISDPVYQ